ncbi:hypothetical protein ACSSS7_005250 [Eimeria intestinalis]
MEGFYVVASDFEGTSAWGQRVVQNVLEAALTELSANPASGAVFDPAKPPFSNQSVQNLAYTMYPESTQVGCARTTDCGDNKVYLLCRFTPPPVEQRDVPFPRSSEVSDCAAAPSTVVAGSNSRNKTISSSRSSSDSGTAKAACEFRSGLVDAGTPFHATVGVASGLARWSGLSGLLRQLAALVRRHRQTQRQQQQWQPQSQELRRAATAAGAAAAPAAAAAPPSSSGSNNSGRTTSGSISKVKIKQQPIDPQCNREDQLEPQDEQPQ